MALWAAIIPAAASLVGSLLSRKGSKGGQIPTLAPPGPAEQEALEQLVRRSTAGTALSEAQVASLMSLIGPETATQLQALQQLQSLLSGQSFTSPTVEAAIRRQRGDVEERLRRQLGPGGEVSTPGGEALTQFGTQSEILREQARGQELQNLLGVLGLLGPQATQRTQVGFGEPSAGILRTTGVAERVGALGAQSEVAKALVGQSGDPLAGLAGLGKLGGVLASKIPWGSLFGGVGSSAAVAA